MKWLSPQPGNGGSVGLPAPSGLALPVSARLEGWLGVGLGLIAWYVALPPLLVRTPFPSLLIAAAGVALGWHARRRGAGRLGYGTIVAALVGGAGAVVSTQADSVKLEEVVVWSALLAASVRYATPVLFAALGGIVSERSGVIALGLEGMVLAGAFFGLWGAEATDSWIAGLGIAALAGIGLAALHAIWSIAFRADQVVSSMALNLFALGLTGYLFIQIYGVKGTPNDVPAIPNVRLSFLDSVPFLGDTLGHSNLMTWLVALGAVALTFFLFRSPNGLRLRAIGEHPDAAASSGLRVRGTRYLAVFASGALAALGGAYLSIGFVHSFFPNMTAGRGYIALAAVIFGAWRCSGAAAATLLFGLGAALAQRLTVFSPSVAVLLQALPYVLTLIAVVGVVGRVRAPAALGKPYDGA